MRRMKKAGQYLLGIFAALLLCGIFSVNTVKAESQHIYDNASLLSDAEEQCRMLKAAASEYCEDTLRRMEEAVADAYDDVKHSRAKFRSALSAASGGPAPRSQPAPRRAMYDAEADEDED